MGVEARICEEISHFEGILMCYIHHLIYAWNSRLLGHSEIYTGARAKVVDNSLLRLLYFEALGLFLQLSETLNGHGRAPDR